MLEAVIKATEPPKVISDTIIIIHYVSFRNSQNCGEQGIGQEVTPTSEGPYLALEGQLFENPRVPFKRTRPGPEVCISVNFHKIASI